MLAARLICGTAREHRVAAAAAESLPILLQMPPRQKTGGAVAKEAAEPCGRCLAFASVFVFHPPRLIPLASEAADGVLSSLDRRFQVESVGFLVSSESLFFPPVSSLRDWTVTRALPTLSSRAESQNETLNCPSE